jgi:hypothetical protein
VAKDRNTSGTYADPQEARIAELEAQVADLQAKLDALPEASTIEAARAEGIRAAAAAAKNTQ